HHFPPCRTRTAPCHRPDRPSCAFGRGLGLLGCVRRRVLVACACCSVPRELLAQKLVAGYFSAGASFTILSRVTGPADLACRTIWQGALGGSSRFTIRRDVALESGCLASRCYRDCHSGGESAALSV